MRPVYGRSPWIERFPKSRVPSYPKHRGDLDIDVAIVGGGLTGCATAYALSAAGVKVALFEADRIGRGGSAFSAGWNTEEPSTSFVHLESALGRRSARQVWHAWRRAALDFEALLRRLDVKCNLEPRNLLTVARTAEQAAWLAREHKARRDAGIEGTLVPPRSLEAITGFPATSAIRSKDNATLDPYRATIGLAVAAAHRGAQIFERSPVSGTSFTRESATVSVGTSRIRTGRVIVTTGDGGALFKPLHRHLTCRAVYFAMTEPVPAAVRRGLGSRDHLLRDLSVPSHRISWLDDDRLFVNGADGDVSQVRTRDRVLVQRTGQLMYELSTFYPDISGLQPVLGWESVCCASSHGLPIIGPHRNYPFHLFAMGDVATSLTGAYLASRILVRHHLEETQPGDETFGFGH